jgi:Nitrile hydratase beta subunit
MLDDVVVEPASPSLPDLDRKPAPWESSMQATCECLSWRGSLDNLERRHAEDELGESIYAGFPVHGRSALVATHALIDKGIITEEELRSKMEEVRARLKQE